jgi:putative ABC transport system ATP-binding protein
MIKVNGIFKEFQSGRGRIQVLKNISFMIETAKTAVIIGKSGSGKTTLLNCIGGLERPDRGSISCYGVDFRMLSTNAISLFLRKNVGFVFQHSNLLSYLTVFENIAFPLSLIGFKETEKRQRVFQLLEKVGLPKLESALPHELSGGEAQRIAFARAIAHSPKMLLADEPTASLDSVTGKRLVELMVEIGRKQGCTLVISTHDTEISNQADVSIKIRDGKIETR